MIVLCLRGSIFVMELVYGIKSFVPVLGVVMLLFRLLTRTGASAFTPTGVV